jgi:hypothetical protein
MTKKKFSTRWVKNINTNFSLLNSLFQIVPIRLLFDESSMTMHFSQNIFSNGYEKHKLVNVYDVKANYFNSTTVYVLIYQSYLQCR